MLRGENWIISKAQKSARETRLAKTKESISLEISEAMINEAIKGNKTLTDEQLKDIVNKYGEMDEDVNGTTSGGGTGESSGSTEELEQEVEKLKTTIETLNKQISKLEKEKETLNAKIAELRTRIQELETELANKENELKNKDERIASLKSKQATGDATADKVLSGLTFSNSSGIGLTGIMPNRGALNWNPSSSTTYTVQPGYYSGGTLNSSGAYNAGKSDSTGTYNMIGKIPSSRFLLISMITSNHWADRAETGEPTVSLTNAEVETVYYRKGLIAKSGYSSIGGHYCLVFAVCKDGIVGATTSLTIKANKFNGGQIGYNGNISFPIMISL